MYYNRQGDQINVLEWGKLFEDKSYQVIKQNYVGDYFVSTVWVGLSYSFELPADIFETMIFKSHEDVLNYQERYNTEEDALRGHDIACNFVRETILAEKAGIQKAEKVKDSQSQAILPSE